jgi:hypothetical protein
MSAAIILAAPTAVVMAPEVRTPAVQMAVPAMVALRARRALAVDQMARVRMLEVRTAVAAAPVVRTAAAIALTPTAAAMMAALRALAARMAVVQMMVVRAKEALVA